MSDTDPFADEDPADAIRNVWVERVRNESQRKIPSTPPFPTLRPQAKVPPPVVTVEGPTSATAWQTSQEKNFDAWEQWTQVPRTRYLDWGSPLLNGALLGTQPGDSILIAGMPNFGKSQLLTNCLQGLLRNNDDVIVLDMSLDDPLRKRFTQYVAALAHMEMNTVDFAHTMDDPGEQKRYAAACQQVRTWLKTGQLIICENTTLKQNGEPVHTASIHYIRSQVKAIRALYPDKKLVIAFDALNNVIVRPEITDDFVTARLIADEIESLLNESGAILLASSHLRKNQGRRPELDDLKGNNALAYAAKVVIGIYNDVKLHKENATVTWVDVDNPGMTMPVVEAHFLKSKVSSFNGCICFQQWPAWGFLLESPQILQNTFFGMIYGKK